MKRLSAVILCAVTASTGTVIADTAYDDERFEVTVLAAGMPSPIEMELAPDGRIFFIELGGKLKTYRPDTKQIVEIGTLDVFTPQENGLIGMALAPDFAKTGHIYLQYSPKTYEGQHISRFTITDGLLDPASEKLLLKFPVQRRECCHHAGSMEFDAKGNLFIATGDNTHPGGDSAGYAPIDERPDRFPFDAQKSASNMNDLRGKILRITPTADGKYTVPDGNLFPKDGSKGKPEIYVMGCRNPWRIQVDPVTGFLYWGEVGPDAGGDGNRGSRGYDEINQARKAGNFGWPYFVGPNAVYVDYDFEAKTLGAKFDPEKPINDSPNNTGGKELPPAQPAWIYYPYGKSKEFPQLGEGGRTACAGPVFRFDAKRHGDVNGGGFPQHLDNCMIIFDWNRPFIHWARLDKDSNLVKIEPFIKGFTFKRPQAFAFAPDGSLFMMDYGSTWGPNPDSRLLHIRYIRGNRPPVARATAKNHIGKAPLKVALSSEGTLDKDPKEKLTYRWRIATGIVGGDDRVIATEANPTVTFDKPGIYNVELTVTDAAGASSAAVVPVLVGNDPPKVKFNYPRDGDFIDLNRAINYELHIQDGEDGDSEYEMPEMNTRTVVTATLRKPGGMTEDPPALAMMKKSDCFNCHAVDRKVIGPSYLDVAAKYKKDVKALDAAAERVVKGSTGVWGPTPMLPHGQHTLDEVKHMVGWVFALKPDANIGQTVKGVIGAVQVPGDGKSAAENTLVIEANYTDKGASPVGALTGRATVTLRNRTVEAESADAIHGARVLGGGSASGRNFIGAIDHHHHLKFAGINLVNVGGVTLRAASAGQGGHIELREGKPDGNLLAKVEVKQTGGWEKWVELAAKIEHAGGPIDLFIVFVNPGKSGLMNLDWVRFEPK